jgi:type I restriction enzyme S subunit
MEVKQGYKQTEIGIISEDWKVYVLGNLLHRIVDVDHYMPKTEKYGVPYLMTGDLKDYASEIDIDNCKKISKDDFKKLSKKIRTLKGDIILARYATVGSVSYVDIDEDFVVSYSCVTIKPDKSRLNDLFLFHYFKSNIFKLEVKNKVNANIQDNVGIGDLMKMKVPLPPTLTEQTAIATALSDADSYIANLEKLIAKKRLIKQGAIQQLLNPKEGWVVKKLGEIFEISGGFSATREELSNEGFCYLHYGDIHGSLKTYIDCKFDYNSIPKFNIQLKAVSKKALLNHGDIVFVDASEDDEGTSRHIVVMNEENIPFIAGLHTIVAKSKENNLDIDYKKYCFQSKYIKDQFKYYSVGTKVSGVSKSSIKNINISFPSIEEQTRIATILSDMDNEIEVLGHKLEKAKQIKQGMTQQLLTGKMRLL